MGAMIRLSRKKTIDRDDVFTIIAERLFPHPAIIFAAQADRADALAGGRTLYPQEPHVSEFPSTLPGVDIASGLARVAGNKNLYIKLLRHVANGAPSTREKLGAAVQAGDANAVREIAHSLKGASGNLSILGVQAAAESLEQAAKAEDFPALIGRLDQLEKALDEYVAVINTLEGL